MKQELLDKIFLTLVDKRRIPYKQAINNKLVEIKIEFVDNNLRKFVEVTHTKVKHRVSYSEYVADIATEIYEIIPNFIPPNGWEEIINRTNQKSVNKFLNFLKKRIKYFTQDEYRRGYDTTTTMKDENGKTSKFHIYIDVAMSSIDVLFTDKNSSVVETPVIETLEKSYWSSKEDTKMNNFMRWFELSKERILNVNQIELLKTLHSVGYSTNDKKTKELNKLGVNTKTISSKLNRIRNKVAKAYMKEKQFFETTFAERSVDKKLGMLKTYINLVESDEDLENQNKKLSKMIRANADSNLFLELFGKLDIESERHIIKCIQTKQEISSDVLYKITTFIYQMIEVLELELIKEQEFKKSVIEEDNPEIKNNLYSGGSSIYLTMDSYGVLHRKDMKQ